MTSQINSNKTKNGIKNSNNTINKNNNKYINMNPRAPHVYGTIRLHKQQKPVCPVVNWKDSPGYKLAKYVTVQLSNILELPNTYNIQNSCSLISQPQI
jgi:hypothetical protein